MESEQKHRLSLLDSLRGIAALSVTTFHVYMNSATAIYHPHVPKFISSIILSGHCGVEIFFVLSGFVIALSLRNFDGGLRAAGHFLLRRQIRLDPPYYVCIFLALFDANIFRLFRGMDLLLPSGTNLLLHFFYLQFLVGAKPVLSIFWTLCLEIQFYLVLCLLLIADARFKNGAQSLSGVVKWVVFATALLSMGVKSSTIEPGQGLFFADWYAFSFGVVLCWYYLERIPRAFPLLLGLGVSILTIVGATKGDQTQFTQSLTVLATGLAIFSCIERKTLASSLNFRPLRFLGRISYSLYLTHFIFGFRIMNLFNHYPSTNPMIGFIYFLLGLVGAIGGAYVYYRLVEKPCVDFASRFKGSR